jgi:hypothetical protein
MKTHKLKTPPSTKKAQPARLQKGPPKTRNIKIGNAVICYNEGEKAWVVPGGKLIYKKAEAQSFCERLAQAFGG